MAIIDILINTAADYAAISIDPAEPADAYLIDVEIAYRDALAAGIDPDEVAAAWNTGMDLGSIPA